MTATSNQTFIVTTVAIVGLIVLIALNKISASDGLPMIGILAGVHLGANVLPVATPPANTTQVTPVTGNTGH